MKYVEANSKIKARIIMGKSGRTVDNLSQVGMLKNEGSPHFHPIPQSAPIDGAKKGAPCAILPWCC